MQKRIRTRSDTNKSDKSKKTFLEILAQIGGLLALIGGLITFITAIIDNTPAILSFLKDDNTPPSIPTNSSLVNLLVPLYIYPDGEGLEDWDSILEARTRVPLTIIVNPDSGPGTPSNGEFCPKSIYNDAIKILTDNDIQTIGYITTHQGNRDEIEVKKEIDIYLNCYQLDGVFIEAKYSANKDKLSYYYSLFWYAKDREVHPTVFLGVGNNPSEDFYNNEEFTAEYYIESPFDTAIIFEGASSPAWAEYEVNTFANKEDTSPPYSAALIHSTPDIVTMQYNINKAIEKHINYVYVTDEVMIDPWGALPSYWDAEVAYIEEINSKLLQP